MCKTKWVTSLDHCAKERMSLTETQYCVGDLIFHLANNPNSYEKGWCNAKRETMAAMLGVSRPTLFRALGVLKSLGLVESKGQRIRTTGEWWANTVGYKQPDLEAPSEDGQQIEEMKSAIGRRDAEIEALKAEIEALRAAIGQPEATPTPAIVAKEQATPAEEQAAQAPTKAKKGRRKAEKPPRSVITDEVVDYLNERTDSKYTYERSSTLKAINARLKEGFSVDDLKMVVDHRVTKWANDPNMAEYLRPETLFGNKCEGYLNAAKRSLKTPNVPPQRRNKESNIDFQTVKDWAAQIEI